MNHKEIDECTERLAQAMQLLEMQIDPARTDESFMLPVIRTVHELVQRALCLHAGLHDCYQISDNTMILLSTLDSLNAIEKARMAQRL